jgi:dTDP-4-dehydrorhamnose 3,5-epimerase/reductase
VPELEVEPTVIPGLLRVHLPLSGDNRGWFKENWQREKMVALGLPDFRPVQHNVSFNARAGVTRGIHAEPWDKYVSVVTGRILGVWVDLREGPGHGVTHTCEMGPETAMFVPQGVGNGFQTLVDATSYSYLVTDHWSPGDRGSYTMVNLADPSLAVDWPIPLAQAEVSAADRTHPLLSEVPPVPSRRTLVIGASGQLGLELARVLPGVDAVTRNQLDLQDPVGMESFPWRRYDTVVNAAAFTAVDAAETAEGRRTAWSVNASAVGRLAGLAARHGFTLVQLSTDYVFDGTLQVHGEDEPFSPLSVYGQTKAAGDALVATHERHYVVRTSWLVGQGANFVTTLARLADQGTSPSVVDDQLGRLTFTTDLARGVAHLLATTAPYGTYNLSSSGRVVSWAEIAAAVFEARDRDPSDVRRVPTREYNRDRAAAPRPRHSTLDLAKIEATGFVPADGDEALAAYLEALDSRA